MSIAPHPDIQEQLLDAADGISKMSRSNIQTLLRQAALEIHELRKALNDKASTPRNVNTASPQD
jgi:hypothetical protein